MVSCYCHMYSVSHVCESCFGFWQGDVGLPGLMGLPGDKGEKGSVGKRGRRVSLYDRAVRPANVVQI